MSTIPSDIDQRVMRRVRPFLEHDCARPEHPAALKVWAEQGMPGLALDPNPDLTDPNLTLPADPDPAAWMVAFVAGPGGPLFSCLDSRVIGLWVADDGRLLYLPDFITDSDLDSMDPIEVAPGG